MRTRIFFLLGFLLFGNRGFSQDPNFYIYLCFGQSNMEGQGAIEIQDKTVANRFKVMETTGCSNLGRIKGNWYTAVPPLCRCYTGLSPADYFGRTMVANLPDSIKVGVINISVAGCKIELFDKDNYQAYAATAPDWMVSIINAYGGNPYAYLVEMAKLAQKDGVIKGILLHQGESNTGDTGWPSKVKGIYDNLISDLGLDAKSVPLLAGELVNADQGGACASMNPIINKLPQTIPNSYVISSSGCTCASDHIHFDAAGYRKFGARYGVKMLSLLGYEATVTVPTEPQIPDNIRAGFYEPECATVGGDWNIVSDTTASNGNYVTVKPGKQSLNTAPTAVNAAVSIPFSVDTTENYYIYARLNCPTADHDSFWLKLDNGPFAMLNGLTTTGWSWLKLTSVLIQKGQHKLTFAYREDGVQLDKIYITDYSAEPTGKGKTALNLCTPDSTATGSVPVESSAGYSLEQNVPNPLTAKARISFEIPCETFVLLRIYNATGDEVKRLVEKKFGQGKHTVEFDSKDLPKGIYFCTFKAGKFTSGLKMIKGGE